jgi:hypothetical protein
MGGGIAPGQIVVLPVDDKLPGTNSEAFTEIVAVLEQPFDMPVTVKVVVTSGLTLATPAELFGVARTYCAGDQE